MEGLNFKGGNPGAVQYGNFINYYKFHSPDSRLEVLPTNIWDTNELFVGLDVGCNTGDLTLVIHKFITNILNKECYLLAVDIDPILILRAKQHSSERIRFECLDFMDKDMRNTLICSYFKDNGTLKFSAAFCFSITMWIHLNHGDEGLQTFLKEICKISKLIIIEPQPWKCYKRAVKRMKLYNKEFNLSKLEIRENVENEIERIILRDHFVKIKETQITEWQRKILIFKRIN